jgi:uncharacterized Ntn-hydrolase superfamily protein
MTFSLIARCPNTGMFGIAAATAVPAVGKLLTHAQSGVGAVATQAKLNPYLGIDGIRLLQNGREAPEVLHILVSQDPRAQTRQCAVIDRNGRTAVWTGDECIPWAGAVERARAFRSSVRAVCREGPRCGPAINASRGRAPSNMRAFRCRETGSPGRKFEAAAAAFKASSGKPFDERLMEALEAGDQAGGDVKGERSATIYIVDREEYPLWDIRVDSHPDPFAELRRLHDIFARAADTGNQGDADAPEPGRGSDGA